MLSINVVIKKIYAHKYKLLGFLLILLVSPFLYGMVWGYVFVKPPSESFPLTLKWQTDLGNFTHERPTYQDGLVLFQASLGWRSAWYGLEATTGQVAWSQTVWRDSYLRCLTSEYMVVSGHNSLMVLNPRNGEIVWPGEIGVVATCSDTIVFTVVPRQFVEALSLSTGEYLWQGIHPRQSVGSLIYNPGEQELIAGGAIVINPASGKVIRSFEPSFIAYPPTDQGRGPMYLIDQGQLFIGGSVRDARTGQVIHKEERFSAFAAPTVTADTIYMADAQESPGPSGVAALDRTTFEVKWRYQPQHKVRGLSLVTLSPVTIFDNIGYVIFSDATLRAFDLETGQEVGYWQLQGLDLMLWPDCTLPFPNLPNPLACVYSSGVGMAASEDILFVSFGDGKLYAFGK